MEMPNPYVCGMVLGEASESDDDCDLATALVPTHNNFLPSNNVKKSTRHKLRYNTLLHCKLKDCNIIQRNCMVNLTEQPIQWVNQQLQELLQLQEKSRVSFHEMPRHFHQLSVALVGLQDRLPTTCNVDLVPC